MDRYDNNSKGTSPALSAILNQFAQMPRSPFDETRTKDLDVPFFGIIPLECFQMFPNSDGYLRYDIKALTKNPTVARMMSNANIELRTYVCKNSDLWEGWNNFVTRGRSGKVTKHIPYLFLLNVVGNNAYTSCLPYNPQHYLNISPSLFYGKDLSVSKNTGIVNLYNNTDVGFTGLFKDSNWGTKNFDSYTKGQSALPAVMYTKIVKEYLNPNLLQNNPNWYPENENHDTILSYECTKASNATYGKEDIFFNDTVDGITYNELMPTNDEKSMPWLNVLYFRQRKGDYFTTASPFPDLLRGDVPTLDVLQGHVDFTNVIGGTHSSSDRLVSFLGIDNQGRLKVSGSGPDFIHYDGKQIGMNNTVWNSISGAVAALQNADGSFNQIIEGTESAHLMKTQGSTEYWENKALKDILNQATIKDIAFTLNEWRRLATMTVFRERMARCDGSYNAMIQAQFKHNPKWHEHSVQYCGGSVQPIVFSEVVQQSESDTTPLGTTAGRAFSDSQSREIKIHTDDFAIMMTVLCVTPNTVYSQGIDRMWSELNQAEQYFPIMNNLEPQAIKNKELFVSGDPSIDEDVFAYQERFSHFKSRQNQVSGLMALPISKVGKTGAYLFNRLFSDTPNFNWDFVQGDMSDNENLCFASTEQAQFTLHVSSQFKYVAPMPAISQASDMGLSY